MPPKVTTKTAPKAAPKAARKTAKDIDTDSSGNSDNESGNESSGNAKARAKVRRAGPEVEGISQKDAKLLAIGFLCLKTEPVLDMEKFAKMANYKSTGVASTVWSRLKRKHILAHLQKNGGPSTAKATGVGRSRKVTAAPKGKGGRSKKTETAQSAHGSSSSSSSDSEDGTTAKPTKKTVATKKAAAPKKTTGTKDAEASSTSSSENEAPIMKGRKRAATAAPKGRAKRVAIKKEDVDDGKDKADSPTDESDNDDGKTNDKPVKTETADA